MKNWMVVVSVLHFCICSCYADQGAEVQLDRLENGAINARGAISSGNFEVSVTEQIVSSPTAIFRFRVWFADRRMRIDRLIRKNTWEKLSVIDNEFYWHTEDRNIVAEMGLKEHSTLATRDIFNPRCLGMFPETFGSLHAWELNRFHTTQRSNVSIENATIDNHPVIIAKFEWGDSVSVTKHFAPDLQNAVTEVKQEWHHGSDTILDTARSRYDRDLPLPVEVIYERWVNSERAHTQTITLTDLRIGNSIDDAVFSFAGMNVPANTMVLEVPRSSKKGVTPMWDGVKLDFSGNRLDKVSSRYSQYWALSIIGGAAAIISGYLLVKGNRRTASED